MKRHAAITQHDDTDRIGEVVIKIIKQHIDKPAADDDADNPHIDKGIKRRRTDNIPGRFVSRLSSIQPISTPKR